MEQLKCTIKICEQEKCVLKLVQKVVVGENKIEVAKCPKKE